MELGRRSADLRVLAAASILKRRALRAVNLVTTDTYVYIVVFI